MNILVTGATGFVGQNLIKRLCLLPNVNLMTVNRDIDKAESVFSDISKIQHVVVEESDAIIAFKPDIVFHLAAMLTSSNSQDVLQPLIEANLLFGTKILHTLRSCNSLRLFVNIGTFAEYRLGSDKIDNAYLYSATKTAFKQILDYYSKISTYSYIHIVPYTIYGGVDTHKKIIDYIKDSFASEIPIGMSKGEQILDFIHIEDVVSFFLYVINYVDKFLTFNNGEVIHLGTGVGTSIKDLSLLLEAKYQKKCNIQWGKLPYRERDVMYAVAPISKLIDLGWKPKCKLQENL